MYTFFNLTLVFIWVEVLLISTFYFFSFRRNAITIIKKTGELYPDVEVLPPLFSRVFTFSHILLIVLTIVLALRFFVVEIWHIPSESMMPTYKVGDSILLNKFAYGVHDPLFNKVLYANDDEPKEGDVIIFRMPDSPGVNFIKRVIGTPGDRISYKNKKLIVTDVSGKRINGINDHAITDSKAMSVEQYYFQQDGMKANEWVVPDNSYFVMGDNRDHSHDSRFWGFVPKQNLIGKVFE
ncbi:signal peptidase I [Photobacterium carnosum]|uniref:Signal peptidase I n=1 Tax=Photobacterium carnosum TaxID=2023717 RepID=A0A2N4UWE4_9GAMM|nr:MULTISPECIES: signal peptidase I [Photobacterium]MCD9476308.1 signal peptidase I [Photobacterium phosphoreum]MCD9488094.1 signal peptidase I [Photobacterium iliopiscarium]MCD9508084.1 signal peptidase I [Photobacterium phosphoreum]MCD9539177.1 signal peptidase I [Photobacterium carnosum]MCD9542341.1 signal peptidase I [Photobacterium carnosum]